MRYYFFLFAVSDDTFVIFARLCSWHCIGIGILRAAGQLLGCTFVIFMEKSQYIRALYD